MPYCTFSPERRAVLPETEAQASVGTILLLAVTDQSARRFDSGAPRTGQLTRPVADGSTSPSYRLPVSPLPEQGEDPEMPQGAVPDRYRDLLESTVLGHLATVDPNGRPQVNPVWFRTQMNLKPVCQEGHA